MSKKIRDHRICGNCAHWDRENVIDFPVWASPDARACKHTIKLCVCKANAIDSDAGECYHLLDEYGHCIQHKGLFEPSEAFLEEHREQDRLDAERVFAQPYDLPPRQPDYLEAI